MASDLHEPQNRTIFIPSVTVPIFSYYHCQNRQSNSIGIPFSGSMDQQIKRHPLFRIRYDLRCGMDIFLTNGWEKRSYVEFYVPIQRKRSYPLTFLRIRGHEFCVFSSNH
jgi:hypothetical protein